MDPNKLDIEIGSTQTGYDSVAAEYASRIFHELDQKPLDRALLDRFADQVRKLGPASDMGCGPGQIARYLADRGVIVCGVDLSSQMVEQARRLNPDIEFRQGNMLALDVADNSWGGIAAFYSIIHIARPAVVRALGEFRRVLKPRGLLLLAFHRGDQTVHLDEWWGQSVSIDFNFFQRDEMEAYLDAAGFEIEEIVERPPYAESVEHQSHRIYIFARKPELPASS